MRDIEWVVCAKFHIDPVKFHSDARAKVIARPRQIAMYLSREMLRYSLPRIGLYFGRDHTTVLHAYRRVQALIASNPKVATHIEECRSALALEAGKNHAQDRAWAAKLKQGLVSWPVEVTSPTA